MLNLHRKPPPSYLLSFILSIFFILFPPHKMAIVSSSTIIRSLSVSQLVIAYFLLTSPSTISDQNLVFILGAAMDLVRLLFHPTICRTYSQTLSSQLRDRSRLRHLQRPCYQPSSACHPSPISARYRCPKKLLPAIGGFKHLCGYFSSSW